MAELAVLVSWCALKGSQDFLHTFGIGLCHKWDVLIFFSLISDSLGGVAIDISFVIYYQTNWLLDSSI